ncbi:MAG: hypothetical protein AAFX93_00970 [Verrucomicrobiota bacterium]
MSEADNQFEITFFESLLRRMPDDVEVLEILAGLYSDEGRIDDSLRMDSLLVDLQPENPTARYNLACSLALKSLDEQALETLRQAIDLGYRDVQWLKDDPDFRELRKHPSFQEILDDLQARPTS